MILFHLFCFAGFITSYYLLRKYESSFFTMMNWDEEEWSWFNVAMCALFSSLSWFSVMIFGVVRLVKTITKNSPPSWL